MKTTMKSYELAKAKVITRLDNQKYGTIKNN